MALDFPASPTNGQKYGQFVYDSALPGWRNVNTTEANTLVQVGLVPVIPTGVSVGSGSATISPTGVVTYTGANYVMVNGIFSSAYDHYQIIFRPNGMSTSDYIYTRFCTGGTANNSSVYSTTGLYSQGATYGIVGNSATLNSFTRLGYSYGDNTSTMFLDIFNPYVAASKTQAFYKSSYATTSHTINTGTYVFGANASFDGILFGNETTGNSTGVIQIFGYRK